MTTTPDQPDEDMQQDLLEEDIYNESDDIFDEESLMYSDKEKPVPYKAIAVVAFITLGCGWFFLNVIIDAVALDEEPAIERLSKANQIHGKDTHENSPLRRDDEYLHEGKKIMGVAETAGIAIENVVKNNPLNLNNVEEVDDLNIDLTFVGNDKIYNTIKGPGKPQAIAPTQRYSLFDVIDSNTYEKTGQPIGRVYDAIIEKTTGITLAIIRDKNGFFLRDLRVLKFKAASYDEINRKTNLSLLRTIDFSNAQRAYIKPKFDEEKYISVRSLRGGFTRASDNTVIGQIIAVTYEDDRAKNIHFQLNRKEASKKSIRTFALPYKAVTYIKNKNGNDIKLTKLQVEALKY